MRELRTNTCSDLPALIYPRWPPCAEDGEYGKETGDTEVCGRPHASAGAGAMTGLLLSAARGDDWDGSV